MSVTVYPTLHLNGTWADTLIADLEVALRAVREAQRALHLAAPHSRDYYVSPVEHASAVAAKEHLARVEKLHSVAVDLESLLAHVWDARDARGR